jgi:uncharacterized protein (TIGR02284 family)
MLLRDERQIALNTVETMCFETADHYESAASRVDDDGLTKLFASLAGQRRQLTDELAVHIRALDDLPQQPDPDRETVEHALTGIKAFFSGDARTTMIDERQRAEDALATAVREALRQDFAPDTHALLERILAHAETAKRELDAARK